MKATTETVSVALRTRPDGRSCCSRDTCCSRSREHTNKRRFRARRVFGVTPAVAVLLVLAAAARAQVVLHPNEIHGTASFDNTNPEILALLAVEGMDLFAVGAQSTPAGFNAQTGYITPTSPTSASYTLSAESQGTSGSVTYTVSPVGWVYRRGPGRTGDGQYFFAPQTVTLRPAEVQPGGVTLNFTETIGVVNLHFRDLTCTTPVPIQSGTLFTPVGYNVFDRPGITDAHYFMRGGTTLDVGLVATTGTDPALDTVTTVNSLHLAAPSDAFQDVCVPLPTVTAGLGTVQTPYDVPGHTLLGGALLSASSGPTARLAQLTATPANVPASAPPTTWPLFPNVPAGSVTMQASDLLDHGLAQAAFRTANSAPFTVASGATTDGSQVLGGALRYPLVMNPAFFTGHILLHDSFVAANPGTPSTLTALLFPNQYLNSAGDPVRGPGDGTSVEADDGLFNAYSVVSFGGFPFDLTTGTLASTYSLPILHPYDQPQTWIARHLALYFSTEAVHHGGSLEATRDYTDPALVNSATYRAGLARVSVDPTPHLIAPGESREVDYALCFNEVRMQYTSARGAFVNPAARITGGFTGTDFRGAPASYTMTADFWGTPAIGTSESAPGFPWLSPANYVATSRSGGEVDFVLPQGTWDISPSATFVDPTNGQTSTGNFVGLSSFTTGCGQRISLAPGLGISLDPFTGCAASTAFDISGSVTASGADVEHVYYTVTSGSGAVTGDICTGTCPRTFSATVPLGPGVNTITVYATSPFLSTTASASAQIQLCDQPPDCSRAAASLSSLWPPNHKLVPIAIEGVTQPQNEPVIVTVTSVTQDEPINGLGDGDTAPDAQLQGAGRPVLIRSERSGLGNGRLYRISFTGTDDRGGSCTGAVQVCVPHDQGRGRTCVDDGQIYDSLWP